MGGTLQTNITGMCGECSQRRNHTRFAPAHGACAFLVYTAQAPGCTAGELSKAGPGFRALPRSFVHFRFRFLGTPQRHRLGWACILCPSQVRAAQVTRCLASVAAATYRLPHPCRSVFWVYNWRTFSGGCRRSRIPGSLG